ncbi:unnamed protein product [Closterium sp. Naga37s-1]|nr:unnamed protein product [Closterium sp. Naga37s-1]
MADAETSEADVAKNRQLIEASREGDLTTVLRLINIEHSSPILSYSALSNPLPLSLNVSPPLPHLPPQTTPTPPPLPPPPLPPFSPSPYLPIPASPGPISPLCPLLPPHFPPSLHALLLRHSSSRPLFPHVPSPPTQNPSSQTPREGSDVAYADMDAQGKTALMAAAEGGRAEVVRALLGEGAVWNAVDMGGKSAGDYAMEGVVAWGEGAEGEGEEEKNEEEKTRRQEVLDTLIDAGIKTELILGAASRNLTRGSTAAGAAEQLAPAPNAAYLSERLQLSESRLVDGEGGGVMMKWEGALMQAHAQAICQQGGDILNIGFGMGLIDTATVAATAVTNRRAALSTSSNRSQPLCLLLPPSLSLQGGDILNIGFGMGIIDTAIAARIGQSEGGIRSHTIVEAHPDVIARMKGEGWHEKEGVRVVEGRWQDVLPQLGQYDEYYEDLREFHSHLPHLLKPSGLYSFFNGMCGDNAFFHTVYCHIVALELQQHVGLTTQFIPLPVIRCLDGDTWAGVRHRYWQLDAYHLPVCYRDETEEGEEEKEQEGVEGEEA